MVKTVETHDEFKKVLKDAGSTPVFVDFTATWCGPCKMIGPKFEAFATAAGSKAIFIKVDVDENEDTAKDCNISAMPTFQCYKNGDKVAEFCGASVDKLKEMITSNSEASL